MQPVNQKLHAVHKHNLYSFLVAGNPNVLQLGSNFLPLEALGSKSWGLEQDLYMILVLTQTLWCHRARSFANFPGV